MYADRFYILYTAKIKRAEDVVMAYLNHICCIFGPSKKILTDNGSEVKNKMWDEVFK